MISIIYGGITHGKCYNLYQSILKELKESDKKINTVDLSVEKLDFQLSEGYRTKRDEKTVRVSNAIRDSDCIIFVYPLYWLNVPMQLKGLIDSMLWPGDAFSFKDKDYYKNGYWKGKKAIIVYTLGGSEWFHKIYRHSGLMAVKYPMKVSGVMEVRHFYIDNLNRSDMTDEKIEKRIKLVTQKVIHSI